MPFSNSESPLYNVATKYHENVVPFEGNHESWLLLDNYQDVAVVDNPPFSMSAKIEQTYFDKRIPFVLFRSAVAYPKFIFKTKRAGVIYENSAKGVDFVWGLEKHIKNDSYITENYPNIIDNIKAMGGLEKRIPVGFSFYKTNYDFKVKTVTFSRLKYPSKKDIFLYFNRGVFDESSTIYEDEEDGRIHIISN